MEYKYSTINEVNHFEFGEAVVGDIQLTVPYVVKLSEPFFAYRTNIHINHPEHYSISLCF